MQQNTRKLNRLFATAHDCHWCGEPTERTTRIPVPANSATVDHVFSRLTPQRKAGNNQVVLACYRCNRWRNDMETKLASPNPHKNLQAKRQLLTPKFPLIRNPFPNR